MFSRTLQIEIETEGERRPCPLDWLDGFFMRRFTGNAAFDDTLPQAEGILEAGHSVDATRLAEEFGDWLTKKKGNGAIVTVHISEEARDKATKDQAAKDPE